jgi:hypothetical protein
MKRILAVILVLVVLGGVGVGGFFVGYSMKEGTEAVAIKLEDCPKPVQDALAREAQGGQIALIQRERKHGGAGYEADAVIGGKNYEIRLADDGTLLVKKLETEKKEKSQEKSGPKTTTR